MKEKIDWVIVGRFGRTYGVKGYITVHSFTEPQDNILNYADWNVFFNKQWQPIRLIEIKRLAKGFIAIVEGFAECELARNLTNAEIGIEASQLPELKFGDYYWHQLIGMHVINQKGESFGKVDTILATGSNDVLVIEGEKRYLIPYLPGKFVLHVYKDKEQIVVDWDLDF